jgi:hypothetical protein
VIRKKLGHFHNKKLPNFNLENFNLVNKYGVIFKTAKYYEVIRNQIWNIKHDVKGK